MGISFYKETEFQENSELGKISKNWNNSTFKDISTVRQGLQIPIKERFKEDGESRYKYITIQSLKDPNVLEYIEAPKKSVICNKEDILMTRTGNTGQVVTDVEGVFHNNFFLVDYDRNNVLKLFLKYYLLNPKMKSLLLSKAGSTTIPDLNHGDFYNTSFVFPKSLEEQQKIAQVLTTIDESIEIVNKELEKWEKIKKATMKKLFSEGIGHTEFQETKIGRFPKSWEIFKLKEFCEIESGNYFELSEFTKKGIKCLKIDNVGFGKITWENKTFLPLEYQNKFSDLSLKVDDVVLALNRPIINNNLKIAILNENDLPCILYQRVGRFIFKNKNLNKKFLLFFLTSDGFKIRLSQILVGTDQPYIRTPILINLEIPLPPIEEQQKIAQILTAIDDTIEIKKKKKEKLERIKNKVMKLLLTGQVRIFLDI